MLEVADQFAEYPGLIGVRDAAVLLLHHGLGQHLRPGQVMQRNLPQLAFVDLGGVLSSDRRDLIRHRDHRIEALLPRDVQVALHLIRRQPIRAGLDLNQGSPRACATTDPQEPIREVALLTQIEGHLDIRLELPSRSPQSMGELTTELAHRRHHR